MIEPYKFYVTLGNITRKEVFPSNSRSLIEQFELNDNDGRYSFINSFSGELIFTNETGDFDFLYSVENSLNKCRAITFDIEKYCSGNYQQWATAKLKLVKGDFDLDKCTLKIPIEANSKYECYETNANTEINLLELPLQKATVHYILGTIEKKSYTASRYLPDEPQHFNNQHPALSGWRLYEVVRHTQNISNITYTFYYSRESVYLQNNQNPGAEWLDLGATAQGRHWVRQPLLIYNYENPKQSQIFGDQYLFNYNVFGDAGNVPFFDNGLKLNDVLNYFVSTYCGLTLRSIFFNINADADFADTYPTFDFNVSTNNILFDKSDVKRPDAMNNASKAITTFKKLLTDVCRIYNLRWDIVNDVFRIEHISFFTRTLTLDVTIGKLAKLTKYTRRYNYKTEQIARREVFKFMESGNVDFTGVPIEYIGDCATEADSTISVEDITTDIEYCLLNAQPNSAKVSDNGFALIAAKVLNNNLYVYSVKPVLESVVRINNVLGWPYLHDKYYRHERLQLNGYMNNNYEVFISAKANRKRTTLRIPFCCNDTINLNGLIKTDMGLARIDSAKFELYNEQMLLEVAYSDSISTAACIRPKSFSFVEYLPATDISSDMFVFETEFIDNASYNTIIEAVLPDATVLTFNIDDDKTGRSHIALLDPANVGVYKFRKRINCADGLESTFTNWVTVTVNYTASCPDIEKPQFLKRTSIASAFTFVFSVDIPEGVRCEVKRPNGEVHAARKVADPRFQYKQFTFDINGVPNHAEGSAVPKGIYSFRFSRVCDLANGNYSKWSNYLEVNV